MPFKKKLVVTVGTKDWRVTIPRPPKFATHAVLTCLNQTYENGEPKTATLPIQDFGCFKGVNGNFSFIRMNKNRRILEEYEGVWYWDGEKVEGIEELEKNE